MPFRAMTACRAGGQTQSVALKAAVLYVRSMNSLFHARPLPPASLLPLALLVRWAEELSEPIARGVRRRRAAR